MCALQAGIVFGICLVVGSVRRRRSPDTAVSTACPPMLQRTPPIAHIPPPGQQASHRNRVYTTRELLQLYAAPTYLVYLALSLASGAAAHVGYNNLLLKNMADQVSHSVGIPPPNFRDKGLPVHGHGASLASR